ncbi:MAG TPA: EF-P lysine aminoacylase EpmA [Rhizomicrobium sp.]|jgi:lysyl-tRNA synthetase class 2|nr:EF-P lysine aminoacylase EpmA [Rhizomicrobium sp.]
MPPQRWWNPETHADRTASLRARDRIKKALRQHFETAGFVEVECGILQTSPGNEAHLHAFATEFTGAGEGKRFYLQTSPEFACKKLLAAGEKRIFEFARVFRNRERGQLHAPEFTMLEWYRANQAYDAVISDCLDLLKVAAGAVPSQTFRFRGRECDLFGAPERLTVAEAFQRFAAIELLGTLTAQGEGNRDALANAARASGIEAAANDSWSDLFSKILVARVEPQLGIGTPAILYEYPRCEAALARASLHDPRVAERFELYACGIELANGFGELTDVAEQRRRFETEMDEKERVYGERYPLDEEFLAALSQMPDSSGVALGFDRLVMLCLGAPSLDDVIWTPLPDQIR